jgi:hypothetical protein
LASADHSVHGVAVDITAPFDRDLELAVFDTRGRPRALVSRCRRILGGWIDAETKDKLSDLRPTGKAACGTCAGRSKLCMHLTFRWGNLTTPAWLTLTVCFAMIVKRPSWDYAGRMEN